MRAVLCASLCNCRHSLRAADDEGLVDVALEHLRRCHPAAPLDERWIRGIVSIRAYDLEYAPVVYEDGMGPDEEFGPEPY